MSEPERDDRGTRPQPDVVVFRPRNLLIWATAFSVILPIACCVGWFSLAPGVRVLFNGIQLATLILFVLVLIGFMMGLGLSVVRADRAGITVRNGVIQRRLAWTEVYAIRYRSGDPWAYALLDGTDDPVRRQLLAIQTTDRQRAIDAVRQLRELVARNNPNSQYAQR